MLNHFNNKQMYIKQIKKCCLERGKREGEEIIKIKQHKLTCIIKINNSSAWEAYFTTAASKKAPKLISLFCFLSAQIVKINNKNAKKSFIFQTFLVFILIVMYENAWIHTIFPFPNVSHSTASTFSYPSIMITKFSESWKIVGHNLWRRAKKTSLFFFSSKKEMNWISASFRIFI